MCRRVRLTTLASLLVDSARSGGPRYTLLVPVLFLPGSSVEDLLLVIKHTQRYIRTQRRGKPRRTEGQRQLRHALPAAIGTPAMAVRE